MNWPDEIVEKVANAIWPLEDLSSTGQEELLRDVRNGLNEISDDVVLKSKLREQTRQSLTAPENEHRFVTDWEPVLR